MNKIYFLVEHTNIHNSSGINTFLNHLKYLLNNIEVVTLQSTVNYINIKSGNFSNKGLIIANDYTSMLYLKNNIDILKKNKVLFYTHIGDMLHLYEKDENLDFHRSVSLEIIDFIKENNIMVGTQSDKYKNFIVNTFSIEKVFTLYEPLFLNNKIISKEKIYDYIIISSFYPRKNFDDMLDYLSKYKHKTLILCSNSEDLHKEVSKRKLNNYVKIISNISNFTLPFFITKSKALLHLAKTEVMPYSILEANRFIPCIINGNSNWGKSIDDYFYGNHIYSIKDTKDFDSIENIFNNLKSFSEEDKLNYNNLKLYQDKVLSQWNTFLEREVFL